MVSQAKQSPEGRRILFSEDVAKKYNVDVLPRKDDNKTDMTVPIGDAKQMLPKAQARGMAFVKRGYQYVSLESKVTYPLQNNDVIILGNTEGGYRILFKESENPFPKQTHPPEPYGEAIRRSGPNKDERAGPPELTPSQPIV